MEEKENILGTEKIGKLVIKFSVPCVISMVVAALYNIVDQIFIGWSEAGEYGNAATNIVYPFTVFALGMALLIGDGAAANFSLFLGAGNKKAGIRSIGNGIIILILESILIMVLGLILEPKILALFGGDPKESLCYGYALDYYGVICIGIPVYILGQGLNGIIRTDGSPRYAMACTLLGAISNIILDPIFIFVFNMGVKGAAIATVIGQGVTFIMSVVYMFKTKNFKLSKEMFHVDFKIIGKIFALGIASLIVQLSIVAIMAVENNLFAKYGYETVASTGEVYGAIIPLAVVGIVMKIFGIVMSIAIGIGLGGQPIIGYNMGAKNIDRVKKCIRYISSAVLIVGTVAFILFEAIPDVFISIFGNQNTTEYVEFARYCIRIFLGGIALTCYIKATSIMLQSMGNSIKSTIIALLRDVIIFIPVTVILAELSHNIITMLWAALIADGISALIAFILLRNEIKKIEKC